MAIFGVVIIIIVSVFRLSVSLCLFAHHLELPGGLCQERPGPEVIKLFSCSTQLSMKFSPLIDVKMLTLLAF